MKVSLNWLREIVELPPTVPALVDLLTMAGVEVEGVATSGVDLPNVVVAQIRESVQHPNADRLSVCQVDHGSGTLRQIVCGAKNYKVGDKAPLALPGAVLGPDFKIKVGKLRGVESQGMLCSAEELGLPKGEEGLLILPPEAAVGAPLSTLYPHDTVLDLEITPNRPDLLSVRGLAIEVGTLTGKQPRESAATAPLVNGIEQIAVSVETVPRCYYSARMLCGVKVGASPEWLLRKLESVGARAINAAVDATNFLLLLTGQPLHVFDAAKLRGGLRVRSARDGEKFKALDGRIYELRTGDLVVADDKQAVAIAGVMGGEDSSVTEDTTDLVIECAWFDPASIRRTSRRLGLSSDSSYRFERTVDISATPGIAEAAAALIAALCAATTVNPLCAASKDEAFVSSLQEPRPALALRAERVERLLGIAVSADRMEQILTGFGLQKTADGWVPPRRRPDLTREVDLIEEIARVVGMELIPPRVQARFAPASEADRAYDCAMILRRAAAAQGLHEARGITLVPAQPLGMAFTRVQMEDLRQVKNPMNDEQVVLRPNLLHGLLKAVAHNQRAGVRSIRLFEIGRVYSAKSPEESAHLALVLSGPMAERTWRAGEGRDADLYDLKGVLVSVLGAGATFEAHENPAVALSLVVKVGGRAVGFAGQLWPADARETGAALPVVFAEIDLAELPSNSASGKYREIGRFPATARDIALLAPLTIPHAQIAATLSEANEPLLAEFDLFDVFTDPTGARVPADQKSLAYSLTYRASDRTLTADEVNAAHARLKSHLKASLDVSFRE